MRTSGLREFIRRNTLQIAVLSGFLIIWGIFFVLSPKVFSNGVTYGAILTVLPIWVILALPLTFITISGEIDLSFGSVTGMGGMVFAWVLISTGNPVLGLLSSLTVCILVGMMIGGCVAKAGLPSIILTLGMMFFLRGVIYVLTNGQSIFLYNYIPLGFSKLLVGEAIFGFPIQMIWAIIIAVLCWVCLNRHVFGAYLYYVGNNETSAKLRGINVSRVKLTAFGVVGAASAIAGVMAVLVNSTFFTTLGDSYLLPVLAMIFVGGTSPKGGTGSIFGTFMGGMIIGIIDSGLIAAGGVGYWTQLFFGLVIILSITIFKFIRQT